MKINLSRQNIYLLSLSTFLFLFVLFFAFALLIPKGKEYRNKKADLKSENVELTRYTDFRNDVLERLTDLKSKNRNIMQALDRNFNAYRFEKQHRTYFKSLTIAPKLEVVNEKEFRVYEVKTTSQINSPKSFYDFLDALNKGDWIISINFPINFKRENDMISSSFTMKVYGVNQDENTTQSTVSK